MSFEVQAAALGLTGVAVGLTAMAAQVDRLARSPASGRRSGHFDGRRATFSPLPHILYFTTEQCSTCRLMQEPALEKVGAPIRRVDAIAERELADRFSIFTVPSTVVVGADGVAANVNYGYAGAEKLRHQLAAAR